MPTGNLWGQATRLVLGAPASSRRVEGAKENHLHPGNHAQSLLSLSLPLSESGSLSSPEAFLAAVAPFFKNSRQRHYVSVHLLRLHGSRPFVLRAKEAGQARVDADDAHSILRLVLLFLFLRHPHHQSAVHRAPPRASAGALRGAPWRARREVRRTAGRPLATAPPACRPRTKPPRESRHGPWVIRCSDAAGWMIRRLTQSVGFSDDATNALMIR